MAGEIWWLAVGYVLALAGIVVGCVITVWYAVKLAHATTKDRGDAAALAVGVVLCVVSITALLMAYSF